MRIAFKPSDLSGVGSYRLLFPMRELEQQYGWECKPFQRRDVPLSDGRVGRVFSTKELPLDAELIVLQREMNLAAVDQIDAWQGEGRKVVLELDDDLSQLAESNPAWLRSHSDPQIRTGSQDVSLAAEFRTFAVNRDNLWEIASAVDALTVSTPALARRYQHVNPNIHVLPNRLDWPMWEDEVPREWDRVRVGYMGVSDWHQDDLREISGIVGPFLEQNPEIDFVAAGDSNVHDLLDIPDGQRISFAAVPFGEHPAITATMDIGLVPLADTPFNQAKSFLKGLEYNACGIPVIASSTEPYRQYVEIGGACVAVKRAHAWLRELKRLSADSALRRTLGRQGRTVASALTIQRSANLWRSAYRQILDS